MENSCEISAGKVEVQVSRRGTPMTIDVLQLHPEGNVEIVIHEIKEKDED